MPPIIDPEKCSKCGMCVEICPADVFYGSKKGEVPTVRYPGECWHASACVLSCPSDAITFRIPLPALVPFTKLSIADTADRPTM